MRRLKQWYWILASIWVVFWILDILILVPLYPDGVMNNIKSIFKDSDTLAFSYLIITAPIYVYLVFMLVRKIVNKIRLKYLEPKY